MIGLGQRGRGRGSVGRGGGWVGASQWESMAWLQEDCIDHACTPRIDRLPYLETSAVGDDGAVPVDERVQPAARRDHLGACACVCSNGMREHDHRINQSPTPPPHPPTRLEEEVVGVAEGQLLARRVPPVVVHRLEGAIGRHGHKPGRVDDAVRGVDPPDARAGAGLGGGVDQFEAEEVFALVGCCWC